MSDLTKRIILGTVIVVTAVLIVLAVNRKDSNTRKTSEQNSPPVPTKLVMLDARERGLKDLVAKDPQNRDLLFQLGTLYFESDRFDRAVEVYRRILMNNDRDVDTLNDLGLALHYTGRSQEGVDALKKGTSIDPTHQRIWLSLGFVLATSGRVEEAVHALQKAIELNPNNTVGQEAGKILVSLRKNK